MKIKNAFSKKARGQIIPLFVIFLPVVIALVALILDGGTLMVSRRQAQAAADAGALAGARELCHHSENSIVKSTAEDFATRNKATNAVATIANGEVTVDTDVITDSFFSRVFGMSNLNAKAEAAAGCFSPNASQVLPVAWSCGPVVGGSDSPDCQIYLLDWTTEMKPLIDLSNGLISSVDIHNLGTINAPWKFSKDYLQKYLYIVADDAKINVDVDPCYPVGNIQCDINGDGINDVFAGGKRSWLNLDGGSGSASELKNWVTGDVKPPSIAIHWWLAGSTATDASVYHAVDGLDFPLMMIPVFDGICNHYPDLMNPAEPCLNYPRSHPPTPVDELVIDGVGADYFHIIGFSAFYVTCVSSGGKNNCPGAQAFIDLNSAEISKNMKSIEGYFVSNYPFDIGGSGTGGVDVGVHIISLTK